MKVKNTTSAKHSWYYYHFHKILLQFFINSSRTKVVFPIQIALLFRALSEKQIFLKAEN